MLSSSIQENESIELNSNVDDNHSNDTNNDWDEYAQQLNVNYDENLGGDFK